MTDSTTNTDRKKPRSPGYPGISLSVALVKADALYKKEGRNRVPVVSAAEAMGYTFGSGTSNTALAALRRFGLLSSEGASAGRSVQLTQLALKIILDEQGESPERAALIQEAALKPPIFNELFLEYPEALPSDSTLRRTLLIDRAFTETAVREFIPAFKATLQFAGLMRDDGTLVKEPVKDSPVRATGSKQESPGPSAATDSFQNPFGTRQAVQTLPDAPNLTAYNIPIGLNEHAVIQLPVPLTEAKWKQLQAVLQAFKPAWVQSADSSHEGALTPSASSDADDDEEPDID